MAQRVVLAVLLVPVVVGLLVAGATSARPPLDVDAVDLPTLTMATLLAVVGAGLMASGVRGRVVARRPDTGRLQSLAIVIGGIALTALAIGVTLVDVDVPRATGTGGGAGAGGSGDVGPQGADVVLPGAPSTSLSFGAVVALALLVAIAAGFTVFWFRRSRTSTQAVVTRRTVDKALAAGRRGLGRRDDDVRAAILAAFAAMESVLGATQGARRVGETQDEFVNRVLGAQDLEEDSLATLAAVYRGARWGAADVGERDRDAALAALDRLLRHP